jgi:hypothetical protein
VILVSFDCLNKVLDGFVFSTVESGREGSSLHVALFPLINATLQLRRKGELSQFGNNSVTYCYSCQHGSFFRDLAFKLPGELGSQAVLAIVERRAQYFKRWMGEVVRSPLLCCQCDDIIHYLKFYLFVDTIQEEFPIQKKFPYCLPDVSPVLLSRQLGVIGWKEVILLPNDSTSCRLELPVES